MTAAMPTAPADAYAIAQKWADDLYAGGWRMSDEAIRTANRVLRDAGQRAADAGEGTS